MDYTIECSSPQLMLFMAMVKNILSIIHILVPILLIIWASIGLFQLVKDPEMKNGTKKIFNRFLAAFIVFMIPTVVNAVMLWIGVTHKISNCWLSAEGYRMAASRYVSIDERTKKTFITNPEDYEKGDPSAKGCGMKLATLAVELAGSATPDDYIKSPDGANFCAFNKSSDSRLQKYNQVHDSRVSCNHAYASCTQAAATVIDAAVDPEINWMGPAAQLYYLQHSNKWQEVKKPANEEWSKYVQPGDVGEKIWDGGSSGHSWIYVGNEVAKKKFSNTDGFIYEGGYYSCKNPYISAEYGWLDSDNQIHYFRFVGDCSQAEKQNLKDGYGGPTDYGC